MGRLNDPVDVIIDKLLRYVYSLVFRSRRWQNRGKKEWRLSWLNRVDVDGFHATFSTCPTAEN